MREYACFTGSPRYLLLARPGALPVTDDAGQRWLCWDMTDDAEASEDFSRGGAGFFGGPLQAGEFAQANRVTCRTAADLPKLLAEGRSIHRSLVAPPPWLVERN